jgi:hypothetical protein
MEGKPPATILASCAQKLGLKWEGETPKKVYSEIIKIVKADGTQGNLNSARSALMQLLNNSRDKLRGKDKKDPLWGTPLKKSFPQEALSEASEATEVNYDLGVAISKFNNARIKDIITTGDILVALIDKGVDARRIASSMFGRNIVYHADLTLKILELSKDAFNTFILRKFVDDFVYVRSDKDIKISGDILVELIKRGADVNRVAEIISVFKEVRHPDLAKILNIQTPKRQSFDFRL